MDVSQEGEEYPETERRGQETDIVTQVQCYFRNGKGGVGLVTWVNDTELEYMEDYQARKQYVCRRAAGKRRAWPANVGTEVLCGRMPERRHWPRM